MNKMTAWLRKQPQWFLAIYAGFAAFATYSCMYAFRKPFTAADFSTVASVKVSYKVWLVAAQVLGYMCSKFYGIHFIAEMKAMSRMRSIIFLIVIAWVPLLLFAVVPVYLKPVCLFINGFPLGMIWGLVFGYLEGRRTTEMMGAVLASSFLFASGFAKTTGKWLMNDLHVSQFWMPFVAGGIFLLPMLLFVQMLNTIPPPTAEDISRRTVRQPMNREERKAFVQQFLPGLVFLVLAYIIITALRDLRDNFMNEIWTGLGQPASAATFTQTELPATLIVLAATASLIIIKRNRLAFMLTHGMILAGILIAIISTWAFTMQYISPYWWMLLTGVGLYISYIPINCIFFERMLATYRIAANVGFVMYIADAFGYFGSLSALFLKEFSGLRLPWVSFYIQILFIGGAVSLVLIGLSALYFNQKRSTSTIGVPNMLAAA